MRPGLVHIYTGGGRGKTEAAMGLAVRAKSRGMRVTFITLGEGREQAEYLGLLAELGIEVAEADFVREEGGSLKGKEALGLLSDMIEGFDLAVLDGFNRLLALGQIGEEDALDFINGEPESLELVLTGNGATPEMIDASDLVTEMYGLK